MVQATVGSQPSSLADDLITGGADRIAEFVFGQPENEKASARNRRRIYHAIDSHGFPAFKFGGTIAARKTAILKWIEAQEKAA